MEGFGRKKGTFFIKKNKEKWSGGLYSLIGATAQSVKPAGGDSWTQEQRFLLVGYQGLRKVGSASPKLNPTAVAPPPFSAERADWSRQSLTAEKGFGRRRFAVDP